MGISVPIKGNCSVHLWCVVMQGKLLPLPFLFTILLLSILLVLAVVISLGLILVQIFPVLFDFHY